MLANIMREGGFGLFENSRYSNIAMRPSYFQYFVDYHNYDNRFANQIITDVVRGNVIRNGLPQTPASLGEIQDMILNSPNPTNIFGLGIIQWTNRARIEPLVQLYIDLAGGRDALITIEQVIAAETQMMINELRSGVHTTASTGVARGSYIPDAWRALNFANLNSANAARSAGRILTISFIRPYDFAQKVNGRGDDAANIFNVMMRGSCKTSVLQEPRLKKSMFRAHRARNCKASCKTNRVLQEAHALRVF